MKQALQSTKIRNTLLVIYVLAVLVFSASARADYRILPVVQEQATFSELKTLTGEVAVTTDQRIYLIVTNQLAYELRAPKGRHEELMSFNGKQVEVQGYEMLYKSGPVHQLSSIGPVLDDQAQDVKELSAPILVVMQMSELTE